MESSYLISTNTSNLTTTEAAFAGGFMGATLIALLIFGVLVVIGGWKIFEKAGEKGWKILIPIYGEYILFKICGAEKWFWGLLCATFISSLLMAVNRIPVDFNASQEIINAQLELVDWSHHVPYIIGLVITGVASLAAEIYLAIRLAKAFGRGLAYTLGLIFFPEIVLIVLGFGSAKYNKKAVK
jgi:hypothetical protein